MRNIGGFWVLTHQVTQIHFSLKSLDNGAEEMRFHKGHSTLNSEPFSKSFRYRSN